MHNKKRQIFEQNFFFIFPNGMYADVWCIDVCMYDCMYLLYICMHICSMSVNMTGQLTNLYSHSDCNS